MSAVLGGGIYGTESGFGSVWLGLDADRLRLMTEPSPVSAAHFLIRAPAGLVNPGHSNPRPRGPIKAL